MNLSLNKYIHNPSLHKVSHSITCNSFTKNTFHDCGPQTLTCVQTVMLSCDQQEEIQGLSLAMYSHKVVREDAVAMKSYTTQMFQVIAVTTQHQSCPLHHLSSAETTTTTHCCDSFSERN